MLSLTCHSTLRIMHSMPSNARSPFKPGARAFAAALPSAPELKGHRDVPSNWFVSERPQPLGLSYASLLENYEQRRMRRYLSPVLARPNFQRQSDAFWFRRSYCERFGDTHKCADPTTFTIGQCS